MTICFAITNFPPDVGGFSTFYKNMADLLANNGHTVIILLPKYNSTIFEEDTFEQNENQIIVTLKKSYQVNLQKYRPYFRPGGLDAPNWIAIGMAMREWLLHNAEKFQIDIVQTIDYGGLGFFLTENQLPPCVVFGHGCLLQIQRHNHYLNDSHLALLTQLEKEAMKLADGVLTHSKLNQKNLGKIINKPVSLVLAPWVHKSQHLSDIQNKNQLLVVSGLSIVKGALVTAAALNILKKENFQTTLTWIGGNSCATPTGKSVANIISTTIPQIWESSFTWLGERSNDDSLQAIAEASIIIIPSCWETFSWVAIEAASLGKPIIMTDNTGASYLFEHERNALIVNAEDATSLANAIKKLSTDNNLAQKLGNNAQQLITHVFDNKKNVLEKIEFYTQVIKKRKKSSRDFENDFKIIKKYLTPYRNLKYRTRAVLKKMIGK